MTEQASSEPEIITVGETRVSNVYGIPKDATLVLERDISAEMSDGTCLSANLFRPEAEGRYPVILYLAPAIKDRFPPFEDYERIPNTGVIRVSEFAAFEAPDPVYWVPHGYVVLAANCRATGGSGGDRFAHFSAQIGRDFHDLVEWAAAQPWCDGNVGANGVSYLAITQWLGAAEKPFHLKAIIPWEGLSDPYREWAFHAGLPDTGFYRIYMSRSADPKFGIVNEGAEAEDMVAEQAAHPLLDEFWRAKHPDLSNIDVPAYICASWSTQGLHNRGGFEGYKQIASADKWLEVHGRMEWESYYSRECLERQRRFFGHYLKGEDTGFTDTPRVRFEVRERFYEGRTRFAGDFPIPGTEYRAFYLDAAAGALLGQPVADEAQLRYSAVKSDAEADGAVFAFTFDAPTELVGNMKLKLWVSADGADDMDLEVGVKKFDRLGNEVFMADYNHMETGQVASGWLRVSHRELDEARSTPQQPWLKHKNMQKLAAGEVVPVEVEILPSGTAFAAGDQLRLVVQGHEILQFGYRNHHDDSVNAGHHILYTGGQYDSHLLVPVIPPAD